MKLPSRFPMNGSVSGDVITEKKVDHLHTPTVGIPSLPIPTMLGGLPGIEAATTSMMK